MIHATPFLTCISMWVHKHNTAIANLSITLWNCIKTEQVIIKKFLTSSTALNRGDINSHLKLGAFLPNLAVSRKQYNIGP